MSNLLHFSKFRRVYREAATLFIASSLEDLEIWLGALGRIFLSLKEN